MAISITRLSGGNTPADGSDPRTFPAIWNSTAALLEANVGAGGASVTTSDTAPLDPADGDMWWKSDEGKLYVYYNDGTSSQWVDAAGPTVAVQSTAPTGFEGQLWLDDTDGSMYVYYVDPGATTGSWIGAVSRSGGILQVVSTTKTDTFTTTSTSFTDVTGLSASITPSSTSSKIYALYDVNMGNTFGTNAAVIRFVRDTTPIFVGDAAGSRTQGSGEGYLDSGVQSNVGGNILDSPATTSTVTYKIQLRGTASGTVAVNRSASDPNTTSGLRAASTITLMEVAG